MESLLKLKGKGNEHFIQAKYENAMSYYLLLLSKLRMYPVFEDEEENHQMRHQEDKLRIIALKNISLIGLFQNKSMDTVY